MSGFVYIWRDKKHNRYYVGSHWGDEDDGYICSSSWMKRAYKLRPSDFKRRIISRVTTNRLDLLKEEQRWFDMIKPEEIKTRYYNLKLTAHTVWHTIDEIKLSVGEKISRSKKGKNTGKRDPSVGQKISETKKKKCAERKETTGSAFTEEHRKSLSECKLGKTQSQESNQKRSKTLKSKYESGELIGRSEPLSHQTKSKISNSLKDVPKSETAKKNMSKAQSKKYLVKFLDDNVSVIHGLKQFCKDNNIPYVTATKALQLGASIKKYNIASIEIYK